ncbi:MAG: Gfo/Idh/MocA family oxidoreductase [Bacteroidales bacterium]|nr:Gfo/Idh/MocA family oxidoreductase [Bacteroidales bacterium]
MKKRNKFRWGIISTGIIANKMAEAINQVPGSEILGVASRRQENARGFAEKYHIKNAFYPYSELITNPDVDIIYIGVPNPFHYELIIESLNNGKHVLCEKPFTLNAKESRECIDLARKKNLFLMEAMWSRFFPAMKELKQIIRDEKLGQLHQVTGDFMIERAYDPEHRLYNIDLGGGALLDIGVYLLSIAQFFLGKPESVAGVARIGSTGVDMLDNMHLRYPGDVYASFVCGFTGYKPYEFVISGSEGYCKITSPFYCPSSFVLGNMGTKKSYNFPYRGNGYIHMIEAVQESILKGETENPLMPLEETFFQMETMDKLRDQWNLIYPGEKR